MYTANHETPHEVHQTEATSGLPPSEEGHEIEYEVDDDQIELDGDDHIVLAVHLVRDHVGAVADVEAEEDDPEQGENLRI